MYMLIWSLFGAGDIGLGVVLGSIQEDSLTELFCRTFYKTLIWNLGPATLSQYEGPYTYTQGWGIGP